ncbi:hypothetical protein GCM10028799_27270 [Kribbella italica]
MHRRTLVRPGPLLSALPRLLRPSPLPLLRTLPIRHSNPRPLRPNSPTRSLRVTSLSRPLLTHPLRTGRLPRTLCLRAAWLPGTLRRRTGWLPGLLPTRRLRTGWLPRPLPT